MVVQRKTVGLNEGQLRRGLSENPQDEHPTLAEAGIDKNLAHRARILCALSDDEFIDLVTETRADVRHSAERTVVARAARQEKHEAIAAVRTVAGRPPMRLIKGRGGG